MSTSNTKKLKKDGLQVYRQLLPSTCVDFSSDEGKRMFAEALAEGNTNIYFKLAAQFLTQEEPNFCALSTLVMVLNALEVDPGRVWKTPWRWYHESMLACCIPIDDLLKTEIGVDQFECLARCNRLKVVRRNPLSLTITDEEKAKHLEEFRTFIRQSVCSENTVLVVSYCRETLGQIGLGHFSPLAAYNSVSDQVLVLDVARFKYPPHWVAVPLLWEAIRETDPATDKPRAYFILSQNERLKPKFLLDLIDQSTLKKVANDIDHWFDKCKFSLSNNTMHDETQLATLFIENVSNILSEYKILEWRNCSMEQNENVAEENCDKVSHRLVQEVSQAMVQEMVGAFETTIEFEKLAKSIDDNKENFKASDNQRALVAVCLFFSWPFEKETECDAFVFLARYCKHVIEQLPLSARIEVESLKSLIIEFLQK